MSLEFMVDGIRYLYPGLAGVGSVHVRDAVELIDDHCCDDDAPCGFDAGADGIDGPAMTEKLPGRFSSGAFRWRIGYPVLSGQRSVVSS